MEGSDTVPFSPEDSSFLPLALAVAPAAIGVAMGILAGAKLRADQRPAAALLALSAGFVAAAPLAVDYARRRFDAPGSSRRESVRRLRSIRDAGVPADGDTYGESPDRTNIVSF